MCSNDSVCMQIERPEPWIEFPSFAKPQEIGHFSTDSENKCHWDKSRLSYYSPPESISTLKLNLNDGFELLISQKSRFAGCLDNLLNWIVEENRRRNCSTDENEFSTNRRKVSLKEIIHGADVVTWRGVFTKLAASPYEEREKWLLGAVRFRDVLFLVMFETEEEKEKAARMTERDRRMTFWGHRFERYVTRSTPEDQAKETNCVVDCNQQFCVVYRTKLTKSDRPFRLFYGAEIDCVDDRGQYIELKTSRVMEGWRQERNFKRFKLFKWWIQSFLVGIDRVICGHRDDEGIIKYLETYDVADMPSMAKDGAGGPAPWSGAACMQFLFQLLSFVDKNVPHPSPPECLSEIAVFEFYPQMRQVRSVKNHDYKSSDVLPDWFVSVFGKI